MTRKIIDLRSRKAGLKTIYKNLRSHGCYSWIGDMVIVQKIINTLVSSNYGFTRKEVANLYRVAGMHEDRKEKREIFRTYYALITKITPHS